MKPLIEKNSIQGITDFVRDLVSALHTYCNDAPISISSRQSRGDEDSTLRRPSRKTDSLNSRKSLRMVPLDEDELSAVTNDTDTAAGSVGINGLIRSGKSSRAASLPRNACSMRADLDRFMLKVIIFILFVLFISNIFLYIQLWKLQAAVKESDGSGFESTIVEPGAGTRNMSPYALTKWKTVLTRALGLVQSMEKELNPLAGDEL